MRRRSFLWSFTATCLAAAPALAADPAIVEVTAKLVEIPSQLPPDHDYAYVMRYVVTGGPLDRRSLLVAHYRPRLSRPRIKDRMRPFVRGKVRGFVVGEVHRLKLSADLKAIWSGAVIDEFAARDRKSVRYWALETDPS
jgi:hypothetical protein